MKRTIVSAAVSIFAVALAAGSVSIAAAQPSQPEQPSDSRVLEQGTSAQPDGLLPKEPANETIVGGTPVAPGEAPYAVSLRNSRNFHFCGGTIINERTIVTAGHCVYDNNDQIYVYTGTLSISGGTKRTVQSVKLHPNYHRGPVMNDVALLILSTPIHFDSNVQPVPLATAKPTPGTRGLIVGWGQIGATRPASSDLLKAEVPVIDDNQCRSYHGTTAITDNQLCTFAGQGVGGCMGDSGGGFVANGQLAGIISWGRPCAAGYPDVLTSIHDVNSWIQSNKV